MHQNIYLPEYLQAMNIETALYLIRSRCFFGIRFSGTNTWACCSHPIKMNIIPPVRASPAKQC